MFSLAQARKTVGAVSGGVSDPRTKPPRPQPRQDTPPTIKGCAARPHPLLMDVDVEYILQWSAVRAPGQTAHSTAVPDTGVTSGPYDAANAAA